MFPKHSDRDILLKCPRLVRSPSGDFVLHALSISRFYNFVSILQKLLSEKELKELVSVSSLEAFRSWAVESLGVKYRNVNNRQCSIFAKYDLISFVIYLEKLKDNETFDRHKIVYVPVLDAVDTLFIIFEQNNLISFLKLLLESENKNEELSRETYTQHYMICEIIKLQLIPNLNLLNFDHLLTIEQRDIYYALAEQRNKKDIENLYTAMTIAISNCFAKQEERINLFDILFKKELKQQSNDNENFIREFLKENYTEDKAANRAFIERLLQERNQMWKLKHLYPDSDQA